ncbi:C-type lectin domain family 4 member M-like isoform X2 [Drosophila busckii]|uniref:C-type lectin domain family 4 member M-like isoform X2 n=1 Tax=Drosophila busckii TaxID=30019 RepID=UPI00083F05F9|nr:C-type lectin domain family 4 member M-like isoform X2 [Drosophila busckii]
MLQKYLFKVILMLAFKELWAAATPETEKDAVNACGLKSDNDADNACGSYCLRVLKPMLEHINLMDQGCRICNITQQSVTQERLLAVEQQLQQERDKVNDFEHKMAVTKEELAKQKKIMEQVECSTPFQKLGNKYYYIEESEQMNWFAAAHRCHELGSHLVKLESLDELNLVSAKLKSSNVYWVDMNDLSKEGEFISLAKGVKPKFQDWHYYEPNNMNNGEHCVSLNDTHSSDRKFHMNDLDCEIKNYFICESPMYAACENNK